MFMLLWCDNTYRQVFLLLQGCLLLPQPISELTDPFVHGSHLQVALVQALSLLLQLRVLIVVELVPQLTAKKDKTLGQREVSATFMLIKTNIVFGAQFCSCVEFYLVNFISAHL